MVQGSLFGALPFLLMTFSAPFGGWLSDRLSDKGDADRAEFNTKLFTWGPDDEQKWTFFRNAVNQLDPIRRDLESWAALTVLDDQVYFARLKAGV